MRTVRACCCTKPSAFGCARGARVPPSAGSSPLRGCWAGAVRWDGEVWGWTMHTNRLSGWWAGRNYRWVSASPQELGKGRSYRIWAGESVWRLCGCAGVGICLEEAVVGGELGKLNGSYRRHKRCILCVLTEKGSECRQPLPRSLAKRRL